MRPLYKQHPVLTSIVAANLVAFIIFGVTFIQNMTVDMQKNGNRLASSSGQLKNTAQKADGQGIVAGIFSDKDKGVEDLSPYEIVKEEDSSVGTCTRKIYKVVIDNRVPLKELESILEDIYEEKKNLSKKIFIYAYSEIDKDRIEKAKYKARLFMEPSCDKNNDYAIDYSF
jgi:hypothetical protein